MQMLPLAGMRVIDYSHFLAGPYLSRCLRGLGAEVIKVERPTTGDAGREAPYLINGQSGYYMQQNMGKKGLCVNMKDPRGRELMQKLIRLFRPPAETLLPLVSRKDDRTHVGFVSTEFGDRTVGEVMTRERPEVVFHAAAYKHVPLMEDDNAWIALRNNTLGDRKSTRLNSSHT